MGRIKKFNEHQIQEGEKSNLNGIKIVSVGNKEAVKQAHELVGDGKDPNLFFVTYSNDYMFYDDDNEMQWYSGSHETAPVKNESEIRVETFGPYEKLEDAMKKADDIDLNGKSGPRTVMIEDRKNGQIYERCLVPTTTIVWDESVRDDTKFLAR
jgi:hypothetical protein